MVWSIRVTAVAFTKQPSHLEHIITHEILRFKCFVFHRCEGLYRCLALTDCKKTALNKAASVNIYRRWYAACGHLGNGFLTIVHTFAVLDYSWKQWLLVKESKNLTLTTRSLKKHLQTTTTRASLKMQSSFNLTFQTLLWSFLFPIHWSDPTDRDFLKWLW